MAIFDNESDALATRGDVAGVAIDVSLAIGEICAILEVIAAGKPIDPDDIKKIEARSRRLEEHFDQLVGWTNESR